MGMELGLSELPELAPLSPIRTPAGDGDEDAAAAAAGCCVTPKAAGSVLSVAMAPSEELGAEDAAGRCVTPTAAAGSVLPVAMAMAPSQEIEGGGAADDADVVCCVTPMAATGSVAMAAAQVPQEEDGGVSYTTPTAAESALREATACPPAPRKKKPWAAEEEWAKRKLQRRLFVQVPHDLTTVFPARGDPPPPPSPSPPAAKKLRRGACRAGAAIDLCRALS